MHITRQVLCILYGVAYAVGANAYVLVEQDDRQLWWILPLLLFITHSENMAVCIITACIGASVIWRHRANIQRLMNHTESKLDFNKLKGKKKA